MSMLLNSRFSADDRPSIELNDLQLEFIEKVKFKLSQGIYVYESVPCAICGSTSLELIAEKDRYGFLMQVSACKSCGLVQTNPRMNQSSYNQFYNTEYRAIYIGTAKPTEAFFERQRSNLGRKIHDYLTVHGNVRDWKNKFVFEVGCGAGGILKYFQEHGAVVKGIDLGEEYLAYGRNVHHLDIQAGTLADVVDHMEVKPDVIIYSHVMEHILDLQGQLSLLKRIMHPDTLLYIEVPGLKYLHRSYENDLMLYLQNAHVYHFTRQTLQNLLGSAGVEVLHGDDFVRSISRYPARLPIPPVHNEYVAIIAYLRRVEWMYRTFPIPPYQWGFRLKRMVYNVLAFFRLLPALKSPTD
ncbi:MAG TPA: class I SAM-dependent methyltransferase [Cyclobacteriaceae bacterium]|nr:class I SAM-dependent methyltransferase [Cyclobacteriaceae bacterium]